MDYRKRLSPCSPIHPLDFGQIQEQFSNMGRPSTYTADVARRICERLATGESLTSICKDDDMPPAPTVRLWALDDREGFAADYTRARDLGLDAMADELVDIANT